MIDHGAYGCVRGVEQRRDSLHCDAFCIAADGQSEIQSRPLVHFDHDTILMNGFKAVCFYCDVVWARRQGRDAILALPV